MPAAAATSSLASPRAARAGTAAGYDVRVSDDWRAIAERWRAIGARSSGTLFQRFDWLDAWYSNIIGPEPNVVPVLVEVSRRDDGELAVLLPMISTRRGRLRVLQFADLTLTDYNAPLLGPAAPTERLEARSLWAAVRRALPPHDLADLRKMPPEIDGRPNPLALLAGVTPCVLNGNLIVLPPDWDTYRYGLVRHDRMEFERCWRVFLREPDARFVRVTEDAEARALLDFMDDSQRQRLAEVGSHFVLDRPHVQAAYRHDLAARLADQSVILTALKAGDAVVAAIFAIADGKSAAILRIAHAGTAWKRIGPGVLVVHRTLHHLHEQGYASVDLSIGNYTYKSRLAPTPTPLVDLVAPLALRGRPAALKHQLVSELRRRPALDKRVRGTVGQIKSRLGR